MSSPHFVQVLWCESPRLPPRIPDRSPTSRPANRPARLPVGDAGRALCCRFVYTGGCGGPFRLGGCGGPFRLALTGLCHALQMIKAPCLALLGCLGGPKACRFHRMGQRPDAILSHRYLVVCRLRSKRTLEVGPYAQFEPLFFGIPLSRHPICPYPRAFAYP